MSDNLNDIENEILDQIYRKDYDKDFEIQISLYTLPLTESEKSCKIHEAGYYLERLKRLNYLEFTNKTMVRADGRDPKYKNNIIMILWDNIHISHKGKRHVEEYRKSLSEKIFESSKNFFKDIVKEFRNKVISHLVSFIIGIGCAYIYYVFVLK